MKYSDRNIITEALLANGHRQIREDFSDGKGGVCARGCIAEAFGVLVAAPYPYYGNQNALYNNEERLGLGIAGDRNRLAFRIETLNDGGCTFRQIADWIEANIPVDDDPIIEIELYANTASTPMLVGA